MHLYVRFLIKLSHYYQERSLSVRCRTKDENASSTTDECALRDFVFVSL